MKLYINSIDISSIHILNYIHIAIEYTDYVFDANLKLVEIGHYDNTGHYSITKEAAVLDLTEDEIVNLFSTADQITLIVNKKSEGLTNRLPQCEGELFYFDDKTNEEESILLSDIQISQL